MSEEHAFLRQIVADPDDDTTRLVYADWLDDHGQAERAELIRLQIERARLPQGDPQAAKLLRREKALLAQHGSEWCDTGLGFVGEAELRRGFIEHVTCCPEDALRAGAALVERFPVRSLCLRVDSLTQDQARALAQQPWLARLRALSLSRAAGTESDDSNAALALILRSPHLHDLEALQLPSSIGTPGAQAVAKAGALVGLRELDLRWSRIGPGDMASLAGAAHLAGLTRLVLENAYLGPEGAAALAGSPHLRNLRNLDLSHTHIQIGGIRALTGSAVLANLERLRLGRLRLGVRAAQCLARCPHLANLRELDLNSNKLGAAGAAALAEGPGLTGLTHLSLRKNRITRAGVQALAALRGRLQRLDLARNDLTAEEKQEARGWFGKGVLKM
jgi:uncharacterized protein (TIGR02996 family)